jgi:hypothetical protein
MNNMLIVFDIRLKSPARGAFSYTNFAGENILAVTVKVRCGSLFALCYLFLKQQ